MFNISRVKLITGWENIRPILVGQGKIPAHRRGLWVDSQNNSGHGKTGQVKRAGFFGRSVTLLKVKLNRGSTIDFINALVEKINSKGSTDYPLKPLSKGGFFRGGASDEEIKYLFDKVSRLVVSKPKNSTIKTIS